MLPSFLRSSVFVLFIPLLASLASATGDGWTTNVDEALQKAKAENKDLLLDFSGSDWCHWCIQLDNEVFSKAEFKEDVAKSFVLVELDFPNDASRISKATQEQNHKWRKRLDIEGFPTIVLIDKFGHPYAKTGYQAGGPQAYLEHLTELQLVRAKRDEAMFAARDAEGLEKAKLLDQAMEAVGPELAFSSYRETVKSIIQLDPENSGGLREKYKSAMDRLEIGKELQTVMQQFHPDKAEEYIDRLRGIEEKFAPTGRLRMEIRGMLAQVYLIAGDESETLTIAEEFINSETIHPEELVQWQLLRSAAYEKQNKIDDAIAVLDSIMEKQGGDLQVLMRCTIQKADALVRNERGEEAQQFIERRLAKATGKEKAILERLRDQLADLLKEMELGASATAP